MDTPVYLFTGFLEAGKTKFIADTLGDPNFFDEGVGRVLVLMCEEGEEELDPTEFASDNVYVEVLDDPKYINPDKLAALQRKHKADLVIIEYNGMWLVQDLFAAMPDDWYVYQEVMMCDASTVEVFNANMRNLVVDKLNGADLVVFNRCDEDTVIEDLHKIVRGVSRRADIIYQRVDGSAAYDDIEDALDELVTGRFGMILRAKGIVASTDGRWIHFDYVPGDSDVRFGAADVTGKLCVIGTGLDKAGLAKLFDPAE